MALGVASSTYRRIQLNFFWAFLYNSVGIPIAAGVLYPLIKPVVVPPAVAGLAMALSSVTVVLSSLALKLWKPPIVGDAPNVEFRLEDSSVDFEEKPLIPQDDIELSNV